jgi:hypothetical protein
MKMKLLATLGRGEEAAEMLRVHSSRVQEVDTWLIQAIIYKSNNQLGKHSWS